MIPNLLLAFVAPVPAIAAAALIGGAGLAIGNALWATTIQRNVPPSA